MVAGALGDDSGTDRMKFRFPAKRSTLTPLSLSSGNKSVREFSVDSLKPIDPLDFNITLDGKR